MPAHPQGLKRLPGAPRADFQGGPPFPQVDPRLEGVAVPLRHLQRILPRGDDLRRERPALRQRHPPRDGQHLFPRGLRPSGDGRRGIPGRQKQGIPLEGDAQPQAEIRLPGAGRVGGKIQGALHEGEIHIAGLRAQSSRRAADEPPPQGEGLLNEGGVVERYKAAAHFADGRLPGGGGQVIQQGAVGGQQVGGLVQAAAKPGDVGLQFGDQFVAQAVAEEGGVGVGGVGERVQAALEAVGVDLPPPDPQQRAHQRDVVAPGVGERGNRHAGQPVQTGAAQQVHQHGFDLIIGVVRHQHGGGFVLFSGLEQEAVAQFAGGFLDGQVKLAGVPGHVIRPEDQGNLHFGGHPPGFPRVGTRFQAQEMIEMGGYQRVIQPGQDIQQGEAVRPAGESQNQR